MAAKGGTHTMYIATLPLDDNGMATLTCYIQEPSDELPGTTRKPAILVLPGGGYQFTSDREAEPVALAYAARGFQAFILRYSTGPHANGLKPLAEASSAIEMIRKNAHKWGVIPNQVFTVGFSAGGHLSGWVGLCGQHKPNGMILAYPAAELFVAGAAQQKRERHLNTLLGTGWSADDAAALNLANQVTADAIPMFCWSTAEDTVATPAPILELATAYARLGRPFELHIFQFGGHAMSLATHTTASGDAANVDAIVAKWVDLSVAWLQRNFGPPPLSAEPYVMPERLQGLL